MNNLHRELAPISDKAWAQIEEDATRTLKRHLAARRVVDLPGKAITDAREIMCSTKLDGIKHIRDKHLAHSLTQTGRERLAKPAPSKSFRDSKDVLDASLPIIEVFCRWAVGYDFSFEDIGPSRTSRRVRFCTAIGG
jgi:uncharacterized linocin/CFP29 family protein